MNKRFSQHIADCIRKGDYAIAEGIMGDDYIVNGSRIVGTKAIDCMFPKEPKHPDDWAMGLKSWCFGLTPRVWVRRGPNRYYIKLTKEEHEGLAHIVRAIFQERKERIKEEKRKHKQKQEYAYYQ